jgi:hypothetical protein
MPRLKRPSFMAIANVIASLLRFWIEANGQHLLTRRDIVINRKSVCFGIGMW